MWGNERKKKVGMRGHINYNLFKICLLVFIYFIAFQIVY